MLMSVLWLSACTAPDEVAVSLDDGSPVFVFCQTFAANAVVVSTVPEEAGDSVVAWSAAGVAQNFLAGDEITYGVSPADFTDVETPKRLDFGSGRITVSLERRDDQGTPESGVFASFIAKDIPETGWLNSLHGLQNRPCK
jgi:hypothetical protein